MCNSYGRGTLPTLIGKCERKIHMSLDLLKASFSAMFNALSQFASQLPTFLEKVTGISSATLIKYFQYAVAALLILFAMLFLQRMYRLLLPKHFAHRYHISRLPKQTIIKRRLPISKNTYELRFPSWQYANADGTRDQRRKGNHVNWQSSTCSLTPTRFL